MPNRSTIGRRAFLALLGVLPAMVAARADDRPRRGIVPLAAVLARVNARYDGTVLDADVRGDRDGRLAYEIRFLTRRGNVIQIRLDAGTGEFLEVEGHGFVDALKPGGR